MRRLVVPLFVMLASCASAGLAIAYDSALTLAAIFHIERRWVTVIRKTLPVADGGRSDAG